MADNGFYIGLDLCVEYTQLSYYDEEKKEPESIYQLNSNDTYMLPNIMFHSNDTKEWYVGASAARERFNSDGLMLEDVVTNVASSEELTIDDISYTYKDLFLQMVKGHIEEFIGRYEEGYVKKLVVTVYQYSEEIYEALEDLYMVMGLESNQIEVISRVNSYIHYVFNQPEELRHNSVALFDYGIDGMDYYRLDLITRTGKPSVIEVIHRDFRSQLTYDMVFGDKSGLDNSFGEIAGKLLKETYVSAVYLTGIGFGDKWLKNSTNIICSGRRVFMGQNIYTKGACYAAFSGDGVIEPAKYTLNTEETVVCDIGIATSEDKKTYSVIAYGGQEWYKMHGSIEVFLDNTKRITMIYKNRLNDEISREIIEVHGLPKRSNKTTKLSLEVEFYGPESGALIIRDVGFGKMYPTTNKIYRKEFTIDNK